MKSGTVSNIIMRVYIMEGMYSVAVGQILAKWCQVVCGHRHPVSTLSISDVLRLEDHAVHVATPLLVSVTMTGHSPTVRYIKTRGTVGNTVVHMHPVSDNPKPHTEKS